MSQRRILVVDDDAEVRRILVACVQQNGLAIDEAADGQEAIDLLAANRYAVVLLDLLMPGVNGFEVLDAIHRDPEPPIVLVVTGADRHQMNQLDASKIHGIVKKPFDPLEIAAVVTACAEIRGRGTFETLAYATFISGAPLIALLKL